jgi:tRNA-2-methylthio-N6-dimethylallyladenosine synthase
VAIDRFPDDVPEEAKRRRNVELLDVQSEICAQNNRAMIGRTVQVLVEGVSKLVSKSAGGVELGWEKRRGGDEITQWIGRTRGDQVVVFDGPASMRGRLVDVRITDARRLTLFAEVVPQASGVPQLTSA